MDDGSDVRDNSQPEPATAPTLPSSKKIIVPIAADVPNEAQTPKQAVAKDEPKKNSDQTPKTTAEDPSSTESAIEAEESPQEGSSADLAPKEPGAQGQAPSANVPETDIGSEGGDEKPSPETQKAVEEAAKAEARERELEDYIDKREFFVPINAVARKRSVKVSAGLTVLVLMLAVVLIDLMLDTGVILLVQKIPHTHFFTTQQ